MPPTNILLTDLHDTALTGAVLIDYINEAAHSVLRNGGLEPRDILYFRDGRDVYFSREDAERDPQGTDRLNGSTDGFVTLEGLHRAGLDRERCREALPDLFAHVTQLVRVDIKHGEFQPQAISGYKDLINRFRREGWVVGTVTGGPEMPMRTILGTPWTS